MFEELFGKRADHIRPGLERIGRAYDFLGKPASRTPCILVGGTNGKGTTSAFIWQMLSQQGIRCGLYSSPHLQKFSERFTLTGVTIDDDLVKRTWESMRTALPADMYEELSFFEVATLIGFILFDELKSEFNVFEVGLGGRFDATNIVSPVLSIITSVGLDHQQFLGATISDIAREKAGIMRGGRPLLLGSMPSEASSVLYADAQRLGVELNNVGLLTDPQELELQTSEYPNHLRHNFRLAYLAVERLNKLFLWGKNTPAISPKEIMPVLYKLPSVRGRYEKIKTPEGLELVLDVAHNIDGIAALIAAFRRDYGELRVPAFVSIMADKDHTEMLDLLRSFFEPIVLFKFKNIRSFERGALALRHQSVDFRASFDSAWQTYSGKWPSDRPWVVCGSLAAIGEVFEYFGIDVSQQQ